MKKSGLKKANKKQTENGTTTIPMEAKETAATGAIPLLKTTTLKEYYRLQKNFVAAMKKAQTILDSPVVKRYTELREAMEQPSAEQQRKSLLGDLYDTITSELDRVGGALNIVECLANSQYEGADPAMEMLLNNDRNGFACILSDTIVRFERARKLIKELHEGSRVKEVSA